MYHHGPSRGQKFQLTYPQLVLAGVHTNVVDRLSPHWDYSKSCGRCSVLVLLPLSHLLPAPIRLASNRIQPTSSLGKNKQTGFELGEVSDLSFLHFW
jgi:hypothetical protein